MARLAGVGCGSLAAQNRHLELLDPLRVGEHVDRDNPVTGEGEVERQFSSVISPGARYAFNVAEETQIVLGFGLPIGLNRATPELAGLLYFSVEHRMFGNKRP